MSAVRAALVNCKCIYCEVETSNSQNGTGVRREEEKRRSLSSVATLTTELPDAVWNINTITVSRERHEMGFHGRAAGHKPKITMRNAEHRLEWVKLVDIGAMEMYSLV